MRHYKSEIETILYELIAKTELKIIQTPAKDFNSKHELEIIRDTLIRALDCVESYTEPQFLHVIKKADMARISKTSPIENLQGDMFKQSR